MKCADERVVTCPYCGYDWAMIRIAGVEYIDHKPRKVFEFRCEQCGMKGLHRERTIDQVYKQVSLQAIENNRDKILKNILQGE